MKIIKRNGAEVPFDITKIITAVTKASDSVGGKARLSREQITDIAAAVTDQCQALNRAVSVEEVQDMVENQLMDIKAHDIARHYITYRYIQSLKRQTNTTDERILSLIECQNEEVKQENANKNPTVNSVQRDYMAGEISKDLTARLLLDPEIVKAHQEGLIHFHDSDYFAQHMHNCDLVNLDDMLQNGTVISGTYIEKPHSFSTACNIATQIIAQVASNQYGGQSISLAHLAPFVDVSRKKIRRLVEQEMEALGIREQDLEESFVRGSGRGGQKVNKTNNCVYLRHTPTGIAVKCHADRSRELNRFLARRELCDAVEQMQTGRCAARARVIQRMRKQKDRRRRRRSAPALSPPDSE